MIINNDLFSSAGKVRVRASTLDPFAGLGGEGYVKARRFDVAMPDHVAAAARIKSDALANLLDAINSGRLAPAGHAVPKAGGQGLRLVKGKKKSGATRKTVQA
jgi:hypothetical protein